MEEWQRLLAEGINTPKRMVEEFPDLDIEMVKEINQDFHIRINKYFLEVAKKAGAPLLKQIVPDGRELKEGAGCCGDPLAEDSMSPVKNIVHRYPDRCLFLVSHQCSFYCRYCTRKRKVSDPEQISRAQIDPGIEYIRSHPEIRDVILSGGDPLMLKDEELEPIVKAVREIPHVEIIRIGTRMPGALPQRITPKLVAWLKKYHPIYMMVHFNHPAEVTPEAKAALELLADNGFPTMNQAVLLKGVNDDPAVMMDLNQALLRARCRPYYLYQTDVTKGTNHFRTTTRKALAVIRGLRGWTSGLAVPHLVIDAPGGGGKIPILPRYQVRKTDQEVVMRNYKGDLYRYPEVPEEELCAPDPGYRTKDDAPAAPVIVPVSAVKLLGTNGTNGAALHGSNGNGKHGGNGAAHHGSNGTTVKARV